MGTDPTYGHYYEMRYGSSTGNSITDVGRVGGYVYIRNYYSGDRGTWNGITISPVNPPASFSNRWGGGNELHWISDPRLRWLGNFWSGGGYFTGSYRLRRWWRHHGRYATSWGLERPYDPFPNLTTFDGTGLDVSSVKSFEHLFRDCPKLESVDFSNWEMKLDAKTDRMLKTNLEAQRDQARQRVPAHRVGA